jgi:hypothetical protein
MVRRSPVWCLSFVLLVACETPREHAASAVTQGYIELGAGQYQAAIHHFEEAINSEKNESAFEGRAKALVKLESDQSPAGVGEEKAALSLRDCQGCGEQREKLAKAALDHFSRPPFSDPAVLGRFLQLSEMAEGSASCALVTAVGKVDRLDDQKRKVLEPALQSEITRLSRALGAQKGDSSAQRAAAGIARADVDAESCEELGRRQAARDHGPAYEVPAGDTVGPPNFGDADGDAYYFVLLSAKLAIVKRSPKEAEILAHLPLVSLSDLTTYLAAMTKSGYERDCAVFMAILRWEGLSPQQRSVLKKPLREAVDSLAPPAGAAAQSKPGHAEEVKLDDVLRADRALSAAQTCTELDRNFATIADGTDKLNDTLAIGGDDERFVFTTNRRVFIHEVLLQRLEHTGSAKDLRQRAKAPGPAR